MSLWDFDSHVIDHVERNLEEACILVGLPPAAADALVDTLSAMLDEVSA
jgi:hypothetical protein